MLKTIKPIAIYLPQFHPIPENDQWWGKGFTEWTNTAKAQPLFKDHYQPHLPADLGFYDLRLEEARLAQEALAKSYGIYGFCYYHYWFNGKQVLEEPLQRKIKNPKEDLPFMMCWANENWTRTWIEAERDVLLKQEYSAEDDEKHMEFLIPYFNDERYIKVNGKPVFMVYRPNLFPDMYKTIQTWRELVQQAGFPDLYIGFARKSVNEVFMDCFDFAFEFQPSFSDTPVAPKATLWERVKIKTKKITGTYAPPKVIINDYEAYANHQMNNTFDPKVYPGITPMWDNTARKKNYPFILDQSTPEKYKQWLQHIADNFPWGKASDTFLFINAWNEWAEGNHLEPCQKWGTAYLEATQEVIEGQSKKISK